MQQLFIKKIKSKKEFNHIPEEYILDILKKEATPKELTALEEHPRPEKSALFKELLKKVRKQLHITHGVFHVNTKHRTELLQELKTLTKNKNITPEIITVHEKLLATHQSTKERLDDYEFIYKILKEKIGMPKSILDISSGINPLAWIYFKTHTLTYTATELTLDDVNFLNHYFSIMKKYGITGKAYQANLLTIKEFPESEVCFLFKVLDNLESLKRNSTRDLLAKISAKTLIVSFPKVSISGKRVSTKRLSWFNRIAKKYETFETRNEIFYIIQR